MSELESVGEECRCECPSCAIGLCLCAPHGTLTVNRAWRQTTPSPIGPGIEVRSPRSGSGAAVAGLAQGDRIVAVDDQQIATDLDAMVLQKAIGAHAGGQSVQLDVLRSDGERIQGRCRQALGGWIAGDGSIERNGSRSGRARREKQEEL